MIVLSFSGKAGAGKDSAANALITQMEQDGIRTRRISFAGPLKDACCAMYKWDRARLESDPYYKEGGLGGWVPKGHPGAEPLTSAELDERYALIKSDGGDPVDFYMCWIELDTDPICVALGMTRRTIMQRVGTECMRDNLHNDHWIILLQAAIDRGEFADVDVGFITDARFINELTFAQSTRGSNILVQRSDVETMTQHTGHASEQQWQQWQDWAVVVQNDISLGLDGLQQTVTKLVYTSMVQRGQIGVFPFGIQKQIVTKSIFGTTYAPREVVPVPPAPLPTNLPKGFRVSGPLGNAFASAQKMLDEPPPQVEVTFMDAVVHPGQLKGIDEVLQHWATWQKTEGK